VGVGWGEKIPFWPLVELKRKLPSSD